MGAAQVTDWQIARALDIRGVIAVFAIMITVIRRLVACGIDRWRRKLFRIASFVFCALAMLLFGIAQTVGLLSSLALCKASVLRSSGSLVMTR